MATKETKKPKAEKPEVKPAPKAEVVEPKVEVVAVPEVDSKPLVPQDYKSKLTRSQIEIIKNTIAKGASDDELKMFLYVCERTKLDPFTKQIHLVPRWDSKMGKEVRVPIVGIDGLRAVAERSGDYAGNDDPVFDDEAKPTKASVTVFKMVQGSRVGFTATARWDQYVPKKKDGSVASPLWTKMPHLMLGKCAEALALRKAFPTIMSGLYVAEEMAQGADAPKLVAKPETNFDKAAAIIRKMNNVEGLEETKKKFEESDKYSAAEKKSLIKIVNERIAEIVPDNDTPRNVPSAQHDEAGGEVAGEL